MLFPQQASALVQPLVLPINKMQGFLLFGNFLAKKEGCLAIAILSEWKVWESTDIGQQHPGLHWEEQHQQDKSPLIGTGGMAPGGLCPGLCSPLQENTH